MREIKFKAKCKLLGRWMYGSLYIKKNGKVYINSTEVDPETVSEFAGLNIKEKDVYEHDILLVKDPLATKTATIIVGFEEGMFVGYPSWLKDGEYIPLNTWINGCFDGIISVVGTIYDNPELIFT